MKIKFLLAFSILLLASCSFTDGISGPTVEPPVPASGTVLFQDDFSNPISGWKHFSAPGGMMDYDSGVYRFIVLDAPYHYWSTPGRKFTDTRVEVDVAKLEGPESNRAGIICRLQNIEGYPHFYFFVISSDGYYAIGRTDNMANVLLGQDQLMYSAYINTGLALNHLRADCAANMLSFYVNGFLISQVTDSALANGEVGLVAGTFEQGGVDIIFDQFIVLQP